jgi:hypothetical protein
MSLAAACLLKNTRSNCSQKTRSYMTAAPFLPVRNFEHTLKRVGERFLIETRCAVCGKTSVVSCYDSSCQE